MMFTSKKMFLLLIPLIIFGCATSGVVMLDSAKKYPPTQSVKIIYGKPDKPYEEIAIIEGSGGIFTTYIQVLKSTQKKAAKIGADAIIPITNENTYQPPSVVKNFDGSPLTIPGGNKITVKCIAIRFK